MRARFAPALAALLVLAALASPPAAAQVSDSFADGDFTANPPWTGDAERFTVVPFGADFALRSDGLAEADTIQLATASTGAYGEWAFRFRYEGVNLSTANGVRFYLVASSADLRGPQQGYYVQLGTNNNDEVRLYRQDGAPDLRAQVGPSVPGFLAGETGEVVVRVTRTAAGAWGLEVNGTTGFSGVVDDTYAASTHLGVWLKHSSTAGQAYYFDDVVQDPAEPADTTPPALLSASALSATQVEVVFDEPVVAEAGDYTISGGVGQPVSAASAPGRPEAVVLTLGTPLTGPATYTVTATDVADAAGNVLAQAEVSFFYGAFGTPAPGDVVINEVMYDPPAPQPAANEWVELLNRSDATFDLAQFQFADAAGTPIPITTTSTPLAPGAYSVLVRDGAAFEAAYPGVPHLVVPGFPNLANSGDRPTILFQGTEIDAVPYTTSWGGVDASLERRDPAGPSAFAFNWGTSTAPARATPGAQNSLYAPDTAGPQPLDADVAATGDTLVVTFDEPLDAASVSPGAFTITGPSAPAVVSATYELGAAPVVTLALGGRLVAGAYTLTVNGVRDLQGNTTQGATLPFTFSPDLTPPAVASAFAADPTTVEVRFTEPVTATAADPARYSISGGIGQPASVTFPADGDDRRARLTLAAPLEERTAYTLTVSGVTDAAGNAMPPQSVLLFIGEGDVAGAGDLVINEVMYDPAAAGSGEYVELYNRSDRLFDLRDFTLTDGGTDADPISATPYLVPPDSFVVVVADAAAFAAAFPGVPFVEYGDFPSLNNSGDAVVLAYRGTIVDEVVFDPRWHRVELETARGISLERRDPAGPSQSAANWSSSLDPRGGTPGRANSVFVVPGEAPPEAGLAVDSPFDPDGGQAAAIRYTLRSDAGLVRVRIFDGAGRPVRQLEAGGLSGRTGTVLWDGRDDAGRALRVGLYVVLLEAVNVEGGATEAHRAAIVLARRF